MSRSNLVSPRQRVLALKGMPWFSTMNRHVALQLARHLDERAFKRDELLLGQHKPIETAYLLVDGEVELRRDGRLVRKLQAPETIGLIGVLARLDGAPGDILASSPVTCLAIDGETVSHVWESSFELTRQTLRFAAERAWQTRGQLPFDAPPSDVSAGEAPNRTLDLVEKLEHLRDGSIFRDVNMEALAEICRNQREIHYEAGQEIWAEHTRADFAIKVVSGVVDVVQDDEVVGQIGSGYVVGLLDSLAEVQRGYAVVANQRTVGLKMSVATLLDVAEDHFQLAMSILAGVEAIAVRQLWRT